MCKQVKHGNINFSPTTIFHVHTHRCGHASDEPEICYIEKAINLGATCIIFTDHCPFPGNQFPWRMDYEMLPDYVSTLKQLKKEFQNQIEIKIGLEAEYFPSYHWYYEELLTSGDFDLLILGQHIYEHEDGSFGYTDVDKLTELRGFAHAMIQGIHSGFFTVLAHPDRSFDRVEQWNQEADAIAKTIIEAATKTGIILEQNITSMKSSYQYKQEFWEKVPSWSRKVYGLDAHSTEIMEAYYKIAKKKMEDSDN